MSFFNELKQRNVFRVAVGYLVSCWLMLQVADLVLENIGAPDWVMQGFMLLLALGFPVAVLFSWAFEITPEGIRRESEIDHNPTNRRITSRKLDRAIIAVLAVALGYFAVDRFFLSAHRPTATEVAKTITADRTAASEEWPPGHEPAATNTSLEALDGRPAIAVLPFDNLSSDPEQAYFADGLAEDLITRLSSWRAFPVIARNSSFRFRGGNVDLKQARDQLGARYIVEGSVRRSGDRIRVSAQLIDAPSDEHVWADIYDVEVSDVFASQDEISAMIAAAVVGDLNRAEAERAQQRGTENLEAWSAYQLGLQHVGSFSRADFAAAREFFELAAERDPRFATALAQLSLVTLWEVALGWNDTPDGTIAAALELARRAESLDPRDPVAQAALGWAYLMSGDLNSGLEAAKRAVQLNPSMPEAWGWLSWAQLLAGNTEACIEAGERTQRLDPLGVISSVVYDNLSQAYWQEGRYEEGLQAAQRLLAELPDYFLGYVYLAMNAVELGRLDVARTAIEAGRRAQPELSLDMVQGSYGVVRPEIDERRNADLRQAGLE